MALIHNDSNGLFLVGKTMRYFSPKGVHAAVALFAAPLMLLMCVAVAISSSHAWGGEEVAGAANTNADVDVPVKSLPSGGPRLAEGGGIQLVPIDEPADLWEALAGGKIYLNVRARVEVAEMDGKGAVYKDRFRFWLEATLKF
jgi:hypothetical protein